jgi:hypothetical protein
MSNYAQVKSVAGWNTLRPRNLKHEWAYAPAYTSNDARLDDLDAWVHRYNWHRPQVSSVRCGRRGGRK